MQKFVENLKNAVQPTIDALKRLKDEGLSALGDFAWQGLKDFYDHFLVPVGKWTFGEGIPRFVDALNNGLMSVNWGRINEGLAKLWDSLANFGTNIVGEGLLWLWENVLVPLGTWTMNEAVPRFLDTMRFAIDAVTNILEALQPLWQWFWDNVLQPVARFAADAFLKAWDGINSALQKFSDWCKEHPATTVVRFTSMFYNFVWMWGSSPRNRNLFTDWGSYDFTVSPKMLDDFAESYGYKLTAEDFINTVRQGLKDINN